MNCGKDRSYRYESIFAHASFQFCGHIDEYLIANTRHLSLLYCQPRFGEHSHLLRRFEEGKLVEERTIGSSQNILGYYLLWFLHNIQELWRFTRGCKVKTIVFCGHPVAFFGMSLVKLFRNVTYAYWIGDYFPVKRTIIRAYEAVKRFYHGKMDFAYYLSDGINRVFNGGNLIETESHRTVMWGLRPFKDCAFVRAGTKRLLFVGLLREGQGVDRLLEFVAHNHEYSLALVGVAANGYEKEIQADIDRHNMADRVYFCNRFHSEAELRDIAKTCFCGVALYDLGRDNFTHYADPGKVKAYMELGLPVVMTRISGVVTFVERFGAGVVVDSIDNVGAAIARIAANAQGFNDGVSAFNAYFDYETYYERSFKAMEGVWK